MSETPDRLPAPASTAAMHAAPDLVSILQNPDRLSPEIIRRLIELSDQGELPMEQAAAQIGTVLLLAPALALHMPASFLEQCRQRSRQSSTWASLALILLHTERRAETIQFLQSALAECQADASIWRLVQHLSDWFPELVDSKLLDNLAKRNRFSPNLIMYRERLMFREQSRDQPRSDRECILSQVFGENPQLLVVHNIQDGQGDEMLRNYALLQALLDGFPTLEITLFTDRSYLYDHPRLHALPISDTDRFEEVLQQPWNGVINFFEPYLESNNYNLAIQALLTEHARATLPRFWLSARKDINHFVFETLCVDGQELAPGFGITKRLMPLNYEITMRLISCMGLPLRTGEQQSPAGAIQASIRHPRIEKAWQQMRANLHDNGCSKVAIVNIFGGQHPTKGFTPDSFGRLADILKLLVDEGYGLVLVPNGDGWGGAEAIQAVREILDPPTSKCVIAAPVLSNAQENMRQLKYFVAWSDLVVTIEGWLVHLAYALGKRFRLLLAPYSGDSEWQPHGFSANQGQWIPPIKRAVRSELVLPDTTTDKLKPPPIHFPEKAILAAAFDLWAVTGNRLLGENLSYWMAADDKDIRRWVVAARGKMDPVYFREELIRALSDPNHTVRGAAATALMSSGQDLTEELSPDWQQVLQAFELLGKCRFRETQLIGPPALAAIRACLTSDEPQMQRDARVALICF